MMRKKCFKWVTIVLCGLLVMLVVVAVQPVNASANTGNRDITDSFTCPEFLAFVRERTGIPHPGRIHQSDVEWIEVVYNSNWPWAGFQRFTSLNGIQYFTALRELFVIGDGGAPGYEHINGGSRLTALDVSHNRALERLQVSGNQLTTLNVSNNHVLKTLQANGNQLTTLDVSNNRALEVLHTAHNQLTTLDISNNPALQLLFVSQNPLTMLNISNNPVLDTIYVEYTNLTTLDLSGAPRLGELIAHNNNLTSLNISNNPELHFLILNDNMLTTLDVSNNPILGVLDVHGNVMESQDVIIGWRDISFLTFYPQNTPATTQPTQTPPPENQTTTITTAPPTTPTITPQITGTSTLRLAIGNTTYTQNNTPRQMDAAPFISGGRTMVPLALIAEALGADVSWDGGTRTVTIISEGTTLNLTIDIPLPNNMGTPVIVGGRTFVPVAFISQTLGANVRWDGDNQAVYIQR
ncbi:MAG: stalk domain-containing protein [Defluviitaleaceae bacterium]|nr:stalk domain-containing protein [Defluviitaleaceae bacterium]